MTSDNSMTSSEFLFILFSLCLFLCFDSRPCCLCLSLCVSACCFCVFFLSVLIWTEYECVCVCSWLWSWPSSMAALCLCLHLHPCCLSISWACGSTEPGGGDMCVLSVDTWHVWLGCGSGWVWGRGVGADPEVICRAGWIWGLRHALTTTFTWPPSSGTEPPH